ncbi:MAG: acyl-CoA dehydratase activase [Deltaproteobacteria bacterium]|nr:acyl-CoA dehydratase activase [Deltaproteobacteria bacterium]
MRYLGIDIGTMFIKAGVVDETGKIVKKWYLRHYFEPLQTLNGIVEEIMMYHPSVFNVTGSAGDILKNLSDSVAPVDLLRSNIVFAKLHYPRIQHIIDIGAGSLSYVKLNLHGEIENINSNSLCAAGTGSFVDEQLSRLGINYDIIKGFKRIENPPSIATRCAVFAKSDITHRQQEGYTKEESYSGLCKGLAMTIYQTLIRGKQIQDDVLVVGGLTLNREVMYWLSKTIGKDIIVLKDSEVSAAIGAAIMCKYEKGFSIDLLLDLISKKITSGRDEKLRPPLSSVSSESSWIGDVYSYVDDWNNEINIYGTITNTEFECFLGMDIGSTSTKCVLIDSKDRIIVDVYRKTSGEPIYAAKMLFRAIKEIETRYNASFKIKGFATTGSGRKLIGELFGADLIVNEITAHAEGALALFGDVKTIFEIGGQDSKYIRIENGKVVDANMNYICAAGTGSFIEEQAKKLGFELRDIGSAVENVSPPFTSDRCTVFMEQDINRLLKHGYTRNEVLAAVHYSVIQNYLTKVVGHRAIDRDSVVFMGATAKNKGLIAAIERLLNVQVKVSPYCHTNGAFGAAILLRKRMQDAQRSRFIGFSLLSSDIKVRKEECRLCANHCQIFKAETQDGIRLSSWGFMCGREEDEKFVRHLSEYEPFEIRERIIRASLLPIGKDYKYTVGIPRALSTYTYYPFFHNLFVYLGFRPVLSKRTGEDIVSLGSSVVTSEFCYPIKVAFGHVRYLFEKAKTDFVFVPDMISEEGNGITTNSLFCPYLSSFGSVVKSVFSMRNEDISRLMYFPIDLRAQKAKIVELIYKNLREKNIEIAFSTVLEAFEKSLQIQRGVEKGLERAGAEIISGLAENEKAIVIVGRPYNSIDGDVNLSIPLKMAKLGFKVIPIDMVPFDIGQLRGRYENIYWEYGQRIISAIMSVAKDKRLSALYISNFKCGPDSFLLSIAEDIMGNKPMLVLEIDEHGADAGYQTRIEAFGEVLRSGDNSSSSSTRESGRKRDIKDRVILIPPMHEITSRLFAAAFRSEGYKAIALPQTNYEAFNIGKHYTRGSECLPMITTLGSLIYFVSNSSYSPDELAYFMPTATGPCRFGQYALLTDIALKRAGMGDIAIISPAAYNTYRGLSVGLRIKLWNAVVIGDLLYKIAMRIRPYETVRGLTDRVLTKYIKIFEKGFERELDIKEILKSAVEDFSKINIDATKRLPLVGVMGEIYVRSEPFSNQELIKQIEAAGAEVWLTPLAEWFHYVSSIRLFFIDEGLRECDPISKTKALLFRQFFRISEREFYDITHPITSDREEPDIEDTIRLGSNYVDKRFEGETIITIGRALEFIKAGVSLIVNVSPFSCMPGTISSGIFEQIQKEKGVCILNLFYDGEQDVNKIIRTAINNINFKHSIVDKKDINPSFDKQFL